MTGQRARLAIDVVITAYFAFITWAIASSGNWLPITPWVLGIGWIGVAVGWLSVWLERRR